MEKLGLKCKQLMAKEIKERIEQSPALFITSFEQLLVPEQDSLRSKLKETGASFFVVKNRLAKRIFKELDRESLAPLIQGLTAISLGTDNAVSISKALVEFAGKYKNFKIMGAYVDKQPLDAALLEQVFLASL